MARNKNKKPQPPPNQQHDFDWTRGSGRGGRGRGRGARGNYRGGVNGGGVDDPLLWRGGFRGGGPPPLNFGGGPPPFLPDHGFQRGRGRGRGGWADRGRRFGAVDSGRFTWDSSGGRRPVHHPVYEVDFGMQPWSKSKTSLIAHAPSLFIMSAYHRRITAKRAEHPWW